MSRTDRNIGRRGRPGGPGSKGSSGASRPKQPVLMVNCANDELFHYDQELTSFMRAVRPLVKLRRNIDRITEDALRGVDIFLSCGPAVPFSPDERSALGAFVASGGAMVLSAGGAEDEFGSTDSKPDTFSGRPGDVDTDYKRKNTGKRSRNYTHLNQFLERFQMQVTDDCIVSLNYSKGFYHPKHLFLRDTAVGPARQDFSLFVNEQKKKSEPSEEKSKRGGDDGGVVWFQDAKELDPVLYGDVNNNRKSVLEESEYTPLSVVAPFACRLRLSGVSEQDAEMKSQQPDVFTEDPVEKEEEKSNAVSILSSGEQCFPSNQCLMAISKYGEGCVVLCGSSHMLSNRFVGQHHNLLVWKCMVLGLLRKRYPDIGENVPEEFAGVWRWLEKSNNDDNETMGSTEKDKDASKTVEVPSVRALSEEIRSCLQDTDDLPSDFTSLFDKKQFAYSTDLVPKIIELYAKLNVTHEPLSVIPPQFEVPLPPLHPAVFMPILQDLPTPALDLFDLDEEFANENVKLAQLTNKYTTDMHLEFYLRQAGETLGVVAEMQKDRDAKNKSQSESKSSKLPGAGDDEEDELEAAFAPNGTQILAYILQRLVNYKKMGT